MKVFTGLPSTVLDEPCRPMTPTWWHPQLETQPDMRNLGRASAGIPASLTAATMALSVPPESLRPCWHIVAPMQETDDSKGVSAPPSVASDTRAACSEVRLTT